jgi:hypothetical protein
MSDQVTLSDVVKAWLKGDSLLSRHFKYVDGTTIELDANAVHPHYILSLCDSDIYDNPAPVAQVGKDFVWSPLDDAVFPFQFGPNMPMHQFENVWPDKGCFDPREPDFFIRLKDRIIHRHNMMKRCQICGCGDCCRDETTEV